jgi:hypothetical protein
MENDENNQNFGMEGEEGEDTNQKMGQNQMEGQDEQNEEMNGEQEENELMYIYEWVDSIELSRPKKNIARDFSDGVLLAEIIKSYLPRLVDLHNYPSCSNTKHKESNWNVLNNKVLKRLGIKLTKKEINDIIKCEHLAIEHLLQRLYGVLQSKINMNKDTKNNSNNNFNKNNIDKLRKTLEEKENVIKQLHDIIEVLQLKLKNSEDMEKILENKVAQLTEALNKNGINEEK